MKKLYFLMMLTMSAFLMSCDEKNDEVEALNNYVEWKGVTYDAPCARFAAVSSPGPTDYKETSIYLCLNGDNHNICWLTCNDEDLGKKIPLNGEGEDYDIYVDINNEIESWKRDENHCAFNMGGKDYMRIIKNGDGSYTIDVVKSTSPVLRAHYKGLVRP